MGVYDGAMTPLEVVTFQSLPVLSTVIGTIGPTIESVDKERGRMIRVKGDAINVRSLVEDIAPALAGILGYIKPAEALRAKAGQCIASGCVIKPA